MKPRSSSLSGYVLAFRDDELATGFRIRPVTPRLDRSGHRRTALAWLAMDAPRRQRGSENFRIRRSGEIRRGH